MLVICTVFNKGVSYLEDTYLGNINLQFCSISRHRNLRIGGNELLSILIVKHKMIVCG
jgi:hypothetical protein